VSGGYETLPLGYLKHIERALFLVTDSICAAREARADRQSWPSIHWALKLPWCNLCAGRTWGMSAPRRSSERNPGGWPRAGRATPHAEETRTCWCTLTYFGWLWHLFYRWPEWWPPIRN